MYHIVIGDDVNRTGVKALKHIVPVAGDIDQAEFLCLLPQGRRQLQAIVLAELHIQQAELTALFVLTKRFHHG